MNTLSCFNFIALQMYMDLYPYLHCLRNVIILNVNLNFAVCKIIITFAM